ncbi:MAG: hypothetical protein KAH56_05035 [Candidatus Krumholzibacteria bacterium]|nr:hypothetical protein [Candidatus Krumholzibacteria bacterium]
MHLGRELKINCPPETGKPVRDERTGLLHRVGRWSPFVFPWSAMQRMTSIIISESGITLARGRLDGSLFHVDGTAHLSGGEASLKLAKLEIPGMEPVCVCLPRNRTMVRHFRVPAESTAEIEAMLPHLLAGELPMAIENFSWVWSPLPTREEGFTLVAVHVARNDRLEEFLAPLATADLNIVGLIPEGWSWAHAIGQVTGRQDPAEEPEARSIIIRREDAFHLIVENSGQLLFEQLFPLSNFQTLASLDWDGSGFAEARKEFEDLLGFPMPKPEVWPDTLESDENLEPEKLFFAASVAAGGLGHDRLMMPQELRQRTRRRMALGTLAKLGRLGVLAVLFWLVFTVYEDGRTRQYLADLEQQVTEDAIRVEDLEMEYNAIREKNRQRAGNTEILQVLASLRRHVKAPIQLAHLNYVQGRGVTLRGVAPSSVKVLEMTEQLETDPLWQGLRVMQLRSEKHKGKSPVQFVVEGRLK